MLCCHGNENLNYQDKEGNITSITRKQNYQNSLNCGLSEAAFTCYRNYCKFELPSRKLDMDDFREALYGQFPTRKLVFNIIPIARECSISNNNQGGGAKQTMYELSVC